MTRYETSRSTSPPPPQPAIFRELRTSPGMGDPRGVGKPGDLGIGPASRLGSNISGPSTLSRGLWEEKASLPAASPQRRRTCPRVLTGLFAPHPQIPGTDSAPHRGVREGTQPVSGLRCLGGRLHRPYFYCQGFSAS